MCPEHFDCKPTVLISDDDGSLREIVASILSASGFQVLLASDGQQALRICQEYKHEIDLLLTDIEMGPDMSGIQLTEQLHLERPETKILFMSGGCPDTGIRGLGWESLRKPFLPESLKRKVWYLLG